MESKSLNVLFAACLVVALSLTGCGGGGGGGGDQINANYKGVTTQATVTETNAKALSADVMEGVEDVSVVGVLAKSAPIPTPASNAFTNTRQLGLLIGKSVTDTLAKSTTAKMYAKTVAQSVQMTEYGYSGSYDVSVSANESTGAISGSIHFNAYKAESYASTITGSIYFSGSVNTSTGDITNINITMSDLQGLDDAVSSYTLNGTIGLAYGDNTSTMSMSVVVEDNSDGSTTWLKDFKLVLTGNTMSISGTYYHNNYGYVVISTLSPLSISTYTGNPTSGQLLFTGSNGSKARLTYTYSGYTVEVDTNGSNSFVLLP